MVTGKSLDNTVTIYYNYFVIKANFMEKQERGYEFQISVQRFQSHYGCANAG